MKEKIIYSLSFLYLFLFVGLFITQSRLLLNTIILLSLLVFFGECLLLTVSLVYGVYLHFKSKHSKKDTYIDSWHEKYINDKKIMNRENKRYQKEQQEEVERILSYRDDIRHASQQNYISLNIDKSFTRYTKEDIKNINDWRMFEKFISGCFKEHGYKATLTSATNDGGKDIIVEKNGVKTYIECKYWQTGHSIGRELIQKLAGAAMMDGVKNAIFITTSSYHSNAYDAARALNSNGFNIQLWDTDKLLKFINNQ